MSWYWSFIAIFLLGIAVVALWVSMTPEERQRRRIRKRMKHQRLEDEKKERKWGLR